MNLRGNSEFFIWDFLMQQIRTHISWFRSFRYLRLSVSLIALLLLFILINISFLFIIQKPTDAQAQGIPVTSEAVTQTPVAAEQAAPEPATTPVASPVPAPAPAATPAPKPLPVYDTVSIPSLGLSSRYVTVGLTSTNAIDVHPSLVGWWNDSAQPGNPGTVFLDGHNPGVFSKLPSITTGTQISIIKSNSEVFNYTVVHTETVWLEGINMRKALSTYGGASEGLNIMTCAGTFIPSRNTTDQRFVVYAVRS